MTETPQDLAEVLEWNPAAKMAWEALSPAHRHEYLAWIDEAEQPETRASRIAGTIERLAGP